MPEQPGHTLTISVVGITSVIRNVVEEVLSGFISLICSITREGYCIFNNQTIKYYCVMVAL